MKERKDAQTERRATTLGKAIALVALADYVAADRAEMPICQRVTLSTDTRASPRGVSVNAHTRTLNNCDRRKNHRRHRLINGVSGAGDRLVSRRSDANWRPLPCSPIASTPSSAYGATP